MASKIVLFRGKVETLEYFSIKMSEEFINMGYEVLVLNLNGHNNKYEELDKIIDARTVIITFNCIGMNGEINTDMTQNIFINILVDHPLYYYDTLINEVHKYKHYIQCDVDRDHVKYMRRFYPDIQHVFFLPLAGSRITSEIGKKPDIRYGIIFTGNYSKPENFDKYMMANGEEYRLFYMDIIDDLIADPSQEITSVMERHIRNELRNISEADVNNCINKMMFIDMYVRFYFRGKVIAQLADSGHRIYAMGKGFEEIKCRHPENIYMSNGMRSSYECLEAISQAYISINVMPWFKRGVHDRIFNSFLNGTVCVTDGSEYISELFDDNTDIAVYSLTNINEISDRVDRLNEDKNYYQEVLRNGYEISSRNTWEKRAHELEEIWQTIN